MPLLFTAQILVRHAELSENTDKKIKETYTDEEVQSIKRLLIENLDDTWLGPDNQKSYTAETTVTFVSPVRPLSHIVIPLADLRKAIVDQMSAGISEMDLPNLLTFIRTVYRQDRD